MTNDEEKFKAFIEAIRAFISWFEDNFGNEEWMDENKEWKPYTELPEYETLKNLLDDNL